MPVCEICAKKIRRGRFCREHREMGQYSGFSEPRRIVLKGKVTQFNRCVRRKTKGKRYGSRAKQRAGWKKAVRSCSRRR